MQSGLAGSLFLVIVILGTSCLLITVGQLETRMWGGTFPGGGSWDVWGIEVHSGFYVCFPLALALLAAATVLYPLMAWLYTRYDPSDVRGLKKWFVVAVGVLLPAIFIVGIPRTVFYGGNQIGLTFPQIITSAYTFSLEYDGSIVSNVYFMTHSIAYYNPEITRYFSITIVGYLSLALVGCFYLHERRIIGFRLFIAPIIASLIFSLYLFGLDFYLIATTNSILSVAFIPIPSYPLGLLILGKQKKQLQTH